MTVTEQNYDNGHSCLIIKLVVVTFIMTMMILVIIFVCNLDFAPRGE